MIAEPFSGWFFKTTGFPPHPWQEQVAASATCGDRLLRLPTGFGKTAGVVLPWLFHRVVRQDTGWPLRLVFCLPMRVLVEQTERALREWLERAGLAGEVGVHVLMGGSDAGSWVLAPERPAILVGTQDMLLSRALNRGFGAARGKWPMEFGLLHQDALWVLDEVQLMDVGLATSTQLAGLRRREASAHGAPRPCYTWWMSATLQPGWLETVDFAEEARTLAASTVRIPAQERSGGLWSVRKALHREPALSEPEEVAARALRGHAPGSLTLVIVNTVSRAVAVFEALQARPGAAGGKAGKARKEGAPPAEAPDVRLVHGRFRGVERWGWAQEFLRPRAEPPPAGRIIVATQVVEAGVDLSARLLVTDLAPWASLVQRFGRAARYEGEAGELVVVGPVPADERRARPYALPELEASAAALERLGKAGAEASLGALEAFEEELRRTDPALLARLYPYAPAHVLRRKDLGDLFDTSPDLSGVDLDVSRYIRGGEERDVTVFWRRLEEPRARFERAFVGPVRREELCAVPVHELREWRQGGDEERAVYRLDYVSGRWERLRRSDPLVPGMTLMLPAKAGGYDRVRGWSPRGKDEVATLEAAPAPKSAAAVLEEASEAEDDDSLSQAASGGWKSIRVHGRETGAAARELGQALGLAPALVQLLELAGRWHDVGKAHRIFQEAIRQEAREQAGAPGVSRELAKAPKEAWRRPSPYPERPGFRHELASTLALFELLRRVRPEHPALVGAEPALREALAVTDVPVAPGERVSEEHPLAREVAALSAADFDLLAWLVCTHHGKVRCAWTGTPHDQEKGHGGIHGVCDGEPLPGFTLETREGAAAAVPELKLWLDSASAGWNGRYGASWRERVVGLLERHGPFQLAYLEALLRAADVRASQLSSGLDEDAPGERER
jgi:CRISPR-associated endonuclease/helicase Cas3